jgi:hypothetical protein
MSPLVIVLIVLGVLLVLGAGSCLLCVGIAATVGDGAEHSDAAAITVTTPGTNLVRDAMALDLETKLRAQGVPATTVMCPPQRGKSFTCELTVNADRAALEVRDTGTGFAFEVPNTAFLDGAKLTTSFQTTIAAKVDARLRAPCFTGTLMKKVGSEFSCDVMVGAAKAGTVAVSVEDAKGGVKMNYTGQGTTPAPTAKPAAPPSGPRVVDFVCPPGKAPGGAVRAGCLCGDDILGTACGAPGNFKDVVETPRGCRLTCN